MAEKKPQEMIEMSDDELIELLVRLKNGHLLDSDYPKLYALVSTFGWLIRSLQEKSLSIKRLQRLFSIKTEKSKYILKDQEIDKKQSDNAAGYFEEGKGRRDSDESKKVKGHGRNGVSAYKGAKRVRIAHENLRPGSRCPDCPAGKLYLMKRPAVTICLTGNAPVSGTIYELEMLRCSSCLKIFKADLPKEAGDKKYDEKAGAIISLLKYGNGVPFYRLENLQKNFGIPLPAATQWEIVEEVGNAAYPIYQELIRQAADGQVIHNDDTTMKILSLMEEIEQEKPDNERCGIFTSGILSKVQDREIALYFSGRKHSGENIEEVLRRRSKCLGPPIQMCDAEARNIPKESETITIYCLTHGRRKFVDLVEIFPPECQVVIEAIAEVYRNEHITKEMGISGRERLEFHRGKSGPVMNELKDWLDKQFEEKRVEPNSSLGRAIKYMRKHWQKLTGFLRIENAPIDNNAVERILKKVILHRKNSYFYKTEIGAAIGDILMSIIQTCNLAKINAFEYLVNIQKYADRVLRNPELWLPWNFNDTKAVKNLS